MGDDTWMNLLPENFNESYPFDSFNVWDLHTVDQGVQNQIFPAIEQDQFDIIIGHFLGVDHCGHRFDNNNIALKEKLNEINLVVENIIQKMNDNTILIIVSDHGMTDQGNHGGPTIEEIETVLFGYTKQGFWKQDNKYAKYDNTYVKQVEQIDIVPTLSFLFNMPIPFNNLGEFIPDFMLEKNSEMQKSLE
ncbi:Alkaline-phosphatase-like, core domain [Pseudocohnilembus persalinus]|uniref:Alkaline-phosphatase-like, core domain n=1 Tax=Pseudocohnilembus persalinus TaxID=266149 RepID=A0A0V0QXZ2_PSEPJ|nr:Alkaline-phosphatase-like, core domain [Pseudocohnilembus persalinus]|eukprot:KRX07110.1 Alkaline-phosphatase-like, core domain [Pseudocohnilembus persalinus]